ncbi:MFS transporter [Microbulbifer sp. PSTR4-B]|uniref:MFS transporter n=1 Tax=Microbulbifer sp. PSTR4-B TaxID=3243396 RepID=UPI0040393288
MARQNQFQLLGKRRFLPLFLTLITVYFNNNIFRNALLVILAFQLAKNEANTLINLATALYLLPFFLFSITAGQLADRFDKSKFIRLIKLLEIPIVLLGAVALYANSKMLSFLVLFLLATHETFYGPARYAVMPQHLKRKELMGANGLAQMAIFAGSLGGAIVGALLADFIKPGQHGVLYLSIVMSGIAVFGYLSSRAIPPAPPLSPRLKVSWNPVKQTLKILQQTMKNPSVFYSIIACSWFWLISTTFIAQIPSFTKNTLGASEPVVTLMICCLTIGISLGSLMCNTLSRGRITLGIVPIGGLGITLGGLGLGFSALGFHTISGASISEFMMSDNAVSILLYTVLVGFSGGIFIVPLYTIIQDRAEKQIRGQILALNNMSYALFVVIISIVNIILLDAAKISITQLIIFLAILNLLALIFICFKLPELLVHLTTWAYTNIVARVQGENLKLIPEQGATLIICTSMNYRAPLILYEIIPRPVRFILPQSLFNHKLIRFSLSNGGTQPIIYNSEKTEKNINLLNEIENAIKKEELLCLFIDKQDHSSTTMKRRKQLWGIFRNHNAPITQALLQIKKTKSQLSRRTLLTLKNIYKDDDI